MRKATGIIVAIMIVFASISSAFGSSFDTAVERLVMKQSETKRVSYIEKIMNAIDVYEAKVKMKKKTSEKEEKAIKLIPELKKSFNALKTKLEKKNKDKKDEKTEDKSDSSSEKSENKTGIYFNAEKSIKEEASLIRQRDNYIKNSISKGISKEKAEKNAEEILGKFPFDLEKVVTTYEIQIEKKKKITIRMCSYEQQWKAPGVPGDKKIECQDQIIGNMKFNYDEKLSKILGYDVYGEETASELQINRYLVDYKPGVIVYAEYYALPMTTTSRTFISNIYTTSAEKARNFKEEVYKNLIKEWNEKAVKAK